MPSYYRNHGGFLIAAALDKYVYVTLHQPFSEDIILKYSSMETARTLDEVQHPIIREALKLVGVPNRIEIASMADIPSGTGLGSSGSFTTALLRALHMLKKNAVTPAGLAEQACHVELDLLKEPIGKQDQYVAALGDSTVLPFVPMARWKLLLCRYRPRRSITWKTICCFSLPVSAGRRRTS